jgi:multiple sugar transport system permease protein
LPRVCCSSRSTSIIPIFQSFGISLYRWDGLGEATYIGLANYQELMTDRNFEISLWNNVKWLALYLLAIPLGLFIALFLNQTVAASGSTNRCSSFPS